MNNTKSIEKVIEDLSNTVERYAQAIKGNAALDTLYDHGFTQGCRLIINVLNRHLASDQSRHLGFTFEEDLKMFL